MKHAFLFGQTAGVSTILLRPKVEAWCEKHDVELVFKDVDARVRAEYGLTIVPTLRYFDHARPEPRTEVAGERGITRFLREFQP